MQSPEADTKSLVSLPDQREYLSLGHNLIAGSGLYFYDARFDAVVFAFRTPGYPLFVAACRADWRLVRFAQCLLDASVVIAVYLTARRWIADQRAALFAAGFIALNPFLIYFSALLLSETLFIAMLAWGIALLSRRWMICGAILLALSVLVRPSAIALPTFACAFAGWMNWKFPQAYQLGEIEDPSPNLSPSTERGVKTKIFHSAIGALATFLVLLPWAYRNHRVIGEWVWTTSNNGITLYDGFNPRATGGSDQSFASGDGPLAMRLKTTNSEMNRSRFLSNLAAMFIRDNPRRVWELTWLKTRRLWSPIPLSNEFGSDWKRVAVAGLYSTLLFGLTLVGLWKTTLPREAKLLLMLPAVYFTVVHAMSVGSLRYRLPADVPMTVVACSAVVRKSNSSPQTSKSSVESYAGES